MKLNDMMNLKKKIAELKSEIAEHDALIDDKRGALKGLEGEYQMNIIEALTEGRKREGNLAIVDKPRHVRKVSLVKLRNYDCDLADDILYRHSNITLKDAEAYLGEDLDEVCDVTTTHNYDVIDVMEGE
jgi:hypothetical protein